jgi:hypothetical protein
MAAMKVVAATKEVAMAVAAIMAALMALTEGSAKFVFGFTAASCCSRWPRVTRTKRSSRSAVLVAAVLVAAVLVAAVLVAAVLVAAAALQVVVLIPIVLLAIPMWPPHHGCDCMPL